MANEELRMKKPTSGAARLPDHGDKETDTASFPPVLSSLPTVYPSSPPLEECLDRFWETGPEFDGVTIRIAPPEQPLALLERLGSSPFPRGRFPLIGFLATTYDKVSRFALERCGTADGGVALTRPGTG